LADKIDFQSFILGLSSAALSYLGYSQTQEIHLELARQNIDIIELLRHKCRLSPEEEKFMDEILRDLRLKFIEIRKTTP
jgi:hypothetical protein